MLQRLKGLAARSAVEIAIAAGLIAWPSTASAQCPADCGDQNGTVNVIDFLALLNQWGQVGSPCDLNGNGVNTADVLGLLQAWGPCPFEVCGSGTGGCCFANGTPGCEEPACCQAVCTSDPFCCDTGWDGLCASVALTSPNCSCTDNPCGSGHGTCCIANGTPGCEDAACCQAVCATDPFCCDTDWDGMCANEAQGMCSCP